MCGLWGGFRYEIVLKLRQTEAPKPDPNQLHRCQLCEKQFESAYYLELHLKRRASPPPTLPRPGPFPHVIRALGKLACCRWWMR